MAARHPRRQAIRVAELLTKSFLAGLTLVEGRPRSGRTDFLVQLFEGLREAAGPMPAFLSLGGPPLENTQIAAQVVAQLLAFDEGRLRSPLVPFERDRLLDRPDFETWQPLLAACERPHSFTQFLAAISAFAGQCGPVCLLADDAPPALLDAAAVLDSPDVAVIAAVNGPLGNQATAGARVLQLEPFSTRETLLLAESLARSMRVRFSGPEAEPFVACLGGDAFALEAVIRHAALHGEALDTENRFVRVYLADCAEGTLAAFFGQRVPGRPGSPARRFALEVLASPGHEIGDSGDSLVEEAWLSRWRPRAPVDDVLQAFAELGWARAGGHGWLFRAWPAARHWAVLQTLAPLSARGTVTMHLAAEVRTAASRSAAEGRRRRIEKSLLALTPEAAARLAPDSAFSSLEILEVASEWIEQSDLFLCFGLAARSAAACATPLLLVAAFPGEGSDPKKLLSQFEARIAQAGTGGSRLEDGLQVRKWLVLDAAESELARIGEESARPGRQGWKTVPFELFNEFAAGSPGAIEVTGTPQLTLSLPAEPEVELAAVSLLDHLAGRQGWEETFVSRARMALVEACLNAVAQARAEGSPERRRIEVRLSASGRELAMSVSNPGAPFDPGDGPATGSSIHRGHGLKIIRSFVDDVHFFADLKGTRIEMRKHFEDKDAAPTKRS